MVTHHSHYLPFTLQLVNYNYKIDCIQLLNYMWVPKMALVTTRSIAIKKPDFYQKHFFFVSHNYVYEQHNSIDRYTVVSCDYGHVFIIFVSSFFFLSEIILSRWHWPKIDSHFSTSNSQKTKILKSNNNRIGICTHTVRHVIRICNNKKL